MDTLNHIPFDLDATTLMERVHVEAAATTTSTVATD